MSERDEATMRGLPDGSAEVSVVLRLRWDDIAALGREAGRLAEQRGAPVSLDDAVSHRLRTWSSVAHAPEERSKAAPAAAPATAAISGTPAGGDRGRHQVGHLSETAPVASITAHPARPA
ncbi:hypothetical protein ACF068_10035 [Streptomyces sp. NPDC016309]|uniref:hypothetical protein n=1 Tax=Streptomyces sp. NPDC016309 TaxID=3364965 RepID=UPI0036FB1736